MRLDELLFKIQRIESVDIATFIVELNKEL